MKRVAVMMRRINCSGENLIITDAPGGAEGLQTRSRRRAEDSSTFALEEP
jgi:hypothetical protein